MALRNPIVPIALQKGLLGLILLVVVPLQAQVETLVIGRSGIPWTDLAETSVALETATVPGAIQVQRLRQDQNVLLGVRNENNQPTDIFGRAWSLEKVPKGDQRLGRNPRYWNGILGAIRKGPQQLIDGDQNTVIKVINVFRGAVGGNMLYTFDFGVPTPINRVVFYPPDNGIDEEGGLRKQRFPRGYEVSAQLEPTDWLLLGSEDGYHTLERVLSRTFFNINRIVDVRFPTEILRFLRLSFNVIDQKYLLGEIEMYGEGFLQEALYRTVVIELDKPANFGRLFWKFSRFRQADSDPVPIADPDAPVELVLETRTGRDDSPLKYFMLNEFDAEEEVDPETYRLAPESSIRLGPRVGDRASIVDDLDNWSPWSTPYSESGQTARSPDGRNFLQIQFKMLAEDFNVFGRLDSIAVEYSPLLVERLIGEVGVEGAPAYAGAVEVPVGVDTGFVYSLRAEFGPDGRRGFDALRLKSDANVRFVGLAEGEQREVIVPDSIKKSHGELAVFFPSARIAMDEGSAHLHLAFRATLLSFSSTFRAEVFEIDGPNLTQKADPGDAVPEIGTDDVQIFATDRQIDLLSSFYLSSSVITPNGDNRNDMIRLDLKLLGVENVATAIEIFDMSGVRVRTIVDGMRSKGLSSEFWDGRDDRGRLVTPGLYLIRVRVETDGGRVSALRTVAVAY